METENDKKIRVKGGNENMGKIIMCGSFKGGVGKTASSWNLAYCLAEMGKKVLAVDFDSQANLSTCFGIEDPAVVPVTIGHLMMNQLEDEKQPEAAEFIQKRNGVDFIPSSMVLSAVDSRLRMEMGAERMLASILEPLREVLFAVWNITEHWIRRRQHDFYMKKELVLL